MSELFSYPEFDKNGVKVLAKAGDAQNDMLMDIAVYQLKAGEERSFSYENDEMAVLLLTGDIDFTWQGKTESGKTGKLDDTRSLLSSCIKKYACYGKSKDRQ